MIKMYKKAKLLGKNDDGKYQGRVLEIISGKAFKILGHVIRREQSDVFYISDRKDTLSSPWKFLYSFLDLEIGHFEAKGDEFKIDQNVIVEIKDGKIASIFPEVM